MLLSGKHPAEQKAGRVKREGTAFPQRKWAGPKPDKKVLETGSNQSVEFDSESDTSWDEWLATD